MTLKNLINNKLRDVKLNHSNGNYRFYLSHTSHFLSWCSNREIELVDQVSEDIIVDYITDLKKTCTNSTINKRIGILKRIWQFSNIEFDYLIKLKKFKEQKKTFSIIDSKDLKKILSYTNSLQDELYNNIMYKAIIMLLIDTGARISEILHIEKKNININSNEILLTTTKTKQDRIVYFLDDTKKILKNIISLNLDSKYILYNMDKNREMKYEDVRFYFRKLKEELNIKKLHPHMFRHTFATKILESDIDLFSLKQLLGHSNMKTTELYLHASNKHIKKQYQNKYKRVY